MRKIPDKKQREKKPREKKPRRTPTAKKIFLIGMFFIAQVIFFNSDFFRLHSVEISGCEKIPNEDIVEAAKFPWGTNVVFLDLKPYEGLIERLLWIKSAKLNKIYPGGVFIDIKERTPVISVRYSENNKWFEMDEEGVILAEQRKEASNDLPRLIVKDRLNVGKRIDCVDIDTIVKFYTWLSPEMSRKIKDFEVEGNSLISFHYFIGTRTIEVKLGKLENVEQKIEVFNKILKELEGKTGEIEYIDLRYREPVVRLNDGLDSVKEEPSVSNKADRSSEPSQSGQTKKPDKPDQAGQIDKPDQADQTDKPDQAGQIDKPDQAGQTDKPDQAGQTDKPDQAGQTDKSDQAGQTR